MMVTLILSLMIKWLKQEPRGEEEQEEEEGGYYGIRFY